MRLAPFLVMLVIASSCSVTSTEPTTSTSFVNIGRTAPTDGSTTSSTSPPLEICESIERFPQTMPDRVVSGVPETANVDVDEFTVLAGAFTAIRFDEEGLSVLVMIRGALPPRQFTGESQVVEILDGIPSVVGPIGDGYWAAAWAIPPGERCDLYSLIFYPPVDESEVLEVTASIE